MGGDTWPEGAERVSRPGRPLQANPRVTDQPPIALGIKPSAAHGPRHHALALALAILAIALALALEERPAGRLALFGRAGFTLPSVCASRMVLGVDCPGCGLTRAIVSLAHGDWRGSWRRHVLGAPLALFILAQVPYRLAVLARQGRRSTNRAFRPSTQGRLDV